MDLLPIAYESRGVALSRREEKALARLQGATAGELLAVERVELVERVKARVVGGVTREAIHEAEDIADEVVRCAQHNPLAAQLAADLAQEGARALKERIRGTNRRLG